MEKNDTIATRAKVKVGLIFASSDVVEEKLGRDYRKINKRVKKIKRSIGKENVDLFI